MDDVINNEYKLGQEAKAIALAAWKEARLWPDSDDVDNRADTARDYIHESCDMHEAAIYTYRAWQLCANVNTSDGEQFLEDCGGISQPGDSINAIMCRLAYAVLYCAACDALNDILEKESE